MKAKTGGVTLWHSTCLITGSLLFLVLTGVHAQTSPLPQQRAQGSGVQAHCAALPTALERASTSVVTLVTNDSTTSRVVYLQGVVKSNGTSVSGDITEYISNPSRVIPFDVSITTVHVEILKPQMLHITWPDGEVTKSLLTCTEAGMYLWINGSSSGLLSIIDHDQRLGPPK